MGPYKLKKPRDIELSANVADGSLAAAARSSWDVHFTLNSGHSLRQSECLLWATTGLLHRSKDCQIFVLILTGQRPKPGVLIVSSNN
jgi:hypothetical protein